MPFRHLASSARIVLNWSPKIDNYCGFTDREKPAAKALEMNANGL
jgi:hypothetical protein